MKYIVNAVITLFSLCIVFLITMRSIGIGAYFLLILLEYILILLLRPELRKATKQFFIKRGSFGEKDGLYGVIHLESFMEDVEKLSPKAFEDFVKEVFVKLGYKVKILEENRELGGDLLLKKDKDVFVVKLRHCESKAEKVENSVVQEVSAAMAVYKANRSMVVCNGSFTDHAYKQASYTKTDMIDSYQLLNLFRKAIQEKPKVLKQQSVQEESSISINEEITKADCLSAQYEHVMTDTFPEVTLEGIYEDKNENKSPKQAEKKLDASNS